jgi:tRNA A37 threonylcarbamoyladenosine modification protein TsaB
VILEAMAGRGPDLIAVSLAQRPSLVVARVGGTVRALEGTAPYPLGDLATRARLALEGASPAVVGVVNGPGPVLALRTAVAFARSLAHVLGVPAAGLHVAEVLAASLPSVRVLWVAEPIGRGRVALARLEEGRIVEETILPRDRLQPPEGEVLVGGVLAGGRPDDARTYGLAGPTPEGLVAATERAWVEGRAGDPRELEVRYAVDAGVRLRGGLRRGAGGGPR